MKKTTSLITLFSLACIHLLKAQSNCVPSTAQTDLDIGNVRATILAGGDMWWDLVNAGYEVPKGSGKHSLFAGALWIGGIDAGGQVKTACQTYRQTGNDFWPGPLPATDSICLAYDKHWKLNKFDVMDFVNTGTTANPDIINYPGNSPLSSNTPLAPYFDANGDGTYNYIDGDYPYFNLGTGTPDCCDMLHGDQCLWWVINDVGNIHTATGSPPLGLEIHCQAYAFDTIHSQTSTTTFYQYKIIYHSTFTLNQCYFGQWVDSDLGNYNDDYVGCDVLKGVGYFYNGDADDEGASGYGLNPPAIGLDFLQGPIADAGDLIDNNLNGVVDELNEDITMSIFLAYSWASQFGNPNGYADFYKYLRGIWLDGLPMTHSCNGRDQSAPLAKYMYPGNLHGGSTDPAFTDDLNEATCGNIPGFENFVMSAGQFTMQPGEINCITVGVIWAKADSGGQVASVDKMLAADTVIQHLFDSCFASFSTGINLAENGNVTGISPNPFSEKTIIRFNNSKSENYSFVMYDMNGSLVKKVLNIKNNFLVIEKGNLKSGMYVFKLSGENGKNSSGKLIVE